MLSEMRSRDDSRTASSTTAMPSCWTRLRRTVRRVAEVGRPDVGDEAGLEALAQAVLERVEVAREAVGGEDELAAGVVQRVERVEELLLGLGLGLEELDVVDQEDVRAAEARLEALDRRRRERARRTRS